MGFRSDSSNKNLETNFFLAKITFYSQEHWLRNSKHTINSLIVLTSQKYIMTIPSHHQLEYPVGPENRRKVAPLSGKQRAQQGSCCCLWSGPTLCPDRAFLMAVLTALEDLPYFKTIFLVAH